MIKEMKVVKRNNKHQELIQKGALSSPYNGNDYLAKKSILRKKKLEDK